MITELHRKLGIVSEFEWPSGGDVLAGEGVNTSAPARRALHIDPHRWLFMFTIRLFYCCCEGAFISKSYALQMVRIHSVFNQNFYQIVF